MVPVSINRLGSCTRRRRSAAATRSSGFR